MTTGVSSSSYGDDSSELKESSPKGSAAPAGERVNVIPATLAEKEKLQARKKRFGVQSEAEKLDARLSRFAAPGASETREDDEEKLRKRAEKFGLLTSEAEDIKKKNRADRFGTSDAGTEDDKKRKRTERFASTDAWSPTSGSWTCDPTLDKLSAEERKQLRAARFRT